MGACPCVKRQIQLDLGWRYIGMLISPFVAMVIYALLTGQFVITLFGTALIPGLIGIIASAISQ